MIHPFKEPIEQLFSRLSHELRTPMTSLQGAISLLQTHQLHEEAEIAPLLTLAAESTERLARVIEDILDWYEITHETKRLFKQPCKIAFLLLQVIDSLQSFAADKAIQIYLKTPTWITLNADHYYLTRTLSHLLHNAIKFSPPNCQIQLTVSICENQGSANLPHLQIAIQDQGIGIPEATLREIFHPFHQLDTSDARCHGGLGLELAICYEVIRQHQGHIWAESELGKGTTFYVVLPIENETAGSLSS